MPGVGTLEPVEVKQLWWLLDGGIMDPEFRDRLRRSWGMCPRHLWGFAVVEIELRGGVPHAASILAEDLLITGGEHRVLGFGRRSLAADAPCPTCEYLAGADPDVEESWRDAAARAARAERTRRLLADAGAALVEHSCPDCLGGDGLVCRPHLVAKGAEGQYLEAQLNALAHEVRAGRRAHEPGAHAPTDDRAEAAWIEALGWLAGWDGVRVWGRSQG
jgi:hypothetical protein